MKENKCQQLAMAAGAAWRNNSWQWRIGEISQSAKQ